MRILVTGSRDWDDELTIHNALFRASRNAVNTPILVSGACPRGADFIAEKLAGAVLGWILERHPADWQRHGKRAGFVRNAEMVALGADICLAFIKNESNGATMTADLATKAGIETIRYRV